MFRKGIFISYSHKDEKWLNIILTFLRPYTRGEKVIAWSDKEIQPGSDWEEEIKSNLNSCRVAILLVSPNFLASDYIIENELPLIFKRHQDSELIIHWIAVSHSAFTTTELYNIQSANDPSKPLDELTKPERDKTLVEITGKIANAMNLNAIGNVLKIIDDFVPQEMAFVKEEDYDKIPNDYSVQAHQEQETIKIKNRGNYVVETITADDLEKLDRNSRILIRTYENTMRDLFERWTELQPRSYSRDPVIKEEARDEMSILRKDLCEQLNAILDYLQFLNKNLDDHYNHVRHICSQ